MCVIVAQEKKSTTQLYCYPSNTCKMLYVRE